ncbi:SMC-Scp complex subunit ScpB [Parasphaerochaeta coccoides]|uniref:Chromosome segregation and condensation protein, ScpB n=1 Tax=Parasphaerochaeta coccoides (strain ATCC BAA-1237 / DSM 17374 / SPN1) TaxID=760011 RepID=F4GK66_PARC1|nr:SMC-Scp complex subunit ScpB [Parasphaerochaeta coccoides]AEC01838.1 chromosome segregation and condensation protein, ScpB [Parasphaerochaeta coccoides DSM 17374]
MAESIKKSKEKNQESNAPDEKPRKESRDVLLSPKARFIEVILFLENEPVSLDKLQRMTGFSLDAIRKALEELSEHFQTYMHGLVLSESTGAWAFRPATDLHETLQSCYGKKVDRRLSRAALETLSIVAYSQPITKREIDNIRGVSSDSIVRLLREREYIKAVGRKNVPGHPILYGTSRKFLYEFNLPSISALPKLSEIDRERFATSQVLDEQELEQQDPVEVAEATVTEETYED